MSRRARISAIALLVLLDAPGVCHAGMPMLSLSDMARARVQSISFFAACFLLCAWFIRRIWNGLVDDFPRLPRLTYGKAVGLVALWGLLFLLVLTMISGARELMTPGAWKKEGLTYRLAEAPRPPEEVPTREEQIRRDRLESLGVLLRHYAEGHGGKFPADDKVPEIPAEAWQLPDPSGVRYLYAGGPLHADGRTTKETVLPLAYEPGIFGAKRLVLMTDGTIRAMSNQELEAKLTWVR